MSGVAKKFYFVSGNVGFLSILFFCSLEMVFAANAPSVLSIQAKTQTTEMRVNISSDPAKPSIRVFELKSINPNVNEWFVLNASLDKKSLFTLHLENPFPTTQTLSLDEGQKNGIVVKSHSGQVAHCDLVDASGQFLYSEKTGDLKLPFIGICDGKAFIRRLVVGQKSSREWMVDLIRRNIWGGEQITTFVKETVYKDSFLIAAEQQKGIGNTSAASMPTHSLPLNAMIEEEFAGTQVVTNALHLETELNSKAGSMPRGAWQPVKEQKGIFVMAVDPASLSRKMVLDTWKDRVNSLTPQELNALTYHIAFDLDQFNFGFVMGTEHPSFDWSERVPPETKKSALSSGGNNLGPDGFDKPDPLVMNGSINPVDTEKVVATFTGGFKRSHGAFKWGLHSKTHRGSHYGFVQSGTVLSSLIPDLATLVVYSDGRLDMLSWSAALNTEKVSNVRHARQNGVPIIEYANSTDLVGVPSQYVKSWNNGNWSGGVEGEQRTLRAGACLQERMEGSELKRYLVYSYFSSATPNAMARVYQGLKCRYAMHLDMNALEHTYLALYLRRASGMEVSHLIKGMEELDKKAYRDPEKKVQSVVPRFIGMPDNRDFFYLIRK